MSSRVETAEIRTEKYRKTSYVVCVVVNVVVCVTTWCSGRQDRPRPDREPLISISGKRHPRDWKRSDATETEPSGMITRTAAVKRSDGKQPSNASTVRYSSWGIWDCRSGENTVVSNKSSRGGSADRWNDKSMYENLEPNMKGFGQMICISALGPVDLLKGSCPLITMDWWM